jgi:hypothetical protein
MVDVLEMHEADIRKLRQSISLKIRQHVYASFSEHLRNRKNKLE